jgi:hypothetical protein
MKKDLTKEEFNKWKDGWYRDKGCPFFICSQSFFRSVCGSSYICGQLYDYDKYKEGKWIKECDIELAKDVNKKLPTSICPSCIGSMSLKINEETGEIIGKSICPLMNDYFKNMGYKINRSLEKYLTQDAAFIIPFIGEEAYLKIKDNPEELKKQLDIIRDNK